MAMPPKSCHTIKGNVIITLLVSSFEAVLTARISQRTQLDRCHRHRDCLRFQNLDPSYSTILTSLAREKINYLFSPGELWMLLDDFIEGGEHRGDGVVARPDVPLRIPARQLLHQVPHRIFPCNTNVS